MVVIVQHRFRQAEQNGRWITLGKNLTPLVALYSDIYRKLRITGEVLRAILTKRKGNRTSGSTNHVGMVTAEWIG